MTKKVELCSSRCTICNTENNSTELYSANLDIQSFNPGVFSARRLPDRIHYRLVKCNTCGLVRSDPVASGEILEQLYSKSPLLYDDEIKNLRLTYSRYLAKLDHYGAEKSAILEIGCGNGFFLEEAAKQGYLTLYGVEPSSKAVAKANQNISQHIICDVMRPGLFKSEQFDVICMFQVLDHISEPVSLLNECFRILKQRGLILCINHNIEAISAKTLRERSPIVDIEHTYLFSHATIRRLFRLCKFEVKKIGTVFNRYTLFYLMRLLPLPNTIKKIALSFLKNNRPGEISLSLPLGNLYLIAQKPMLGNRKGYG